MNLPDLKVLDPIWTTANIVRNHGYMVWDTLFAMDEGLKPQVERLRDAYARAPDLESRKRIAADLRGRAVQYGTHIHLAQYTLPTATRGLSGMVKSPIPVFWNIEKQGN